MRAIIINEFGGPDVMHEGDLPLPQPGPGEVRVKIAYAGLNPADWKTRQGRLAKYITYIFPFVLGFDLAGIVDATGPGVTAFKPGARVFGTSKQGQGMNGAYAEYAITDAAMLAPVPTGLSLAQAAILPTAGTTALGGLLDVGGLTRGQTVLINGGAGGVGSMAIQIARAIGARSLATCSAPHADYVTSLGAEAIDYHTQDVVAAVRRACPDGVDLVLDAVGLDSLLPQATALVRPGGIYVEIETLISAASPAQIAAAKAHGVFIESNMRAIARLPEQLTHLAQFAAAGQVKPQLTALYKMGEVAQAHERLEQGHVGGKLALEINPALENG